MFVMIGRSALLVGVGALLLLGSPHYPHGPDKVQISGAQRLTAAVRQAAHTESRRFHRPGNSEEN
jgi:hypothetical protein